MYVKHAQFMQITRHNTYSFSFDTRATKQKKKSKDFFFDSLSLVKTDRNLHSIRRRRCKEINGNVYFTSAAEDASTFAGIVFKQSNISLSLWLDVGMFTNTNSSDLISVCKTSNLK